jgi:U3 small nucleolar RNA-associated protein 4
MSSATELATTKTRLRRTPPRLFASTGSSTLYEWEWTGADAGRPKASLPTEGGNIWSLAVNPSGTSLAVGCEDGVVRIVNLWDDEFEVVRRLDQVATRPLSLAWGPQVTPLRTRDAKGKGRAREGDDAETPSEPIDEDVYLVAGGADSCLRKFDVRSGRCVTKMTTDRLGREQTLVWAVAVLSDHTIISGDSMGVVKFWDGVMGTQLQSHKAHKADVLCMTVGPVRWSPRFCCCSSLSWSAG